MSIDVQGYRSADPGFAAGRLQEQRSGLSGFGVRPALHPAWCEPADERPDHRSGADRMPISRSTRR